MNRLLCATFMVISVFSATRQGMAELKAGDTALVVKPNVKLKSRETTVELCKGQQVTVTEVRGEWIGCWLELERPSGRQEMGGWLSRRDLGLAWYDVIIKSLGPTCERRKDGVVLLATSQLGEIGKIPRIGEIEELHIGVFDASTADEGLEAGIAAIGALKSLKRLTLLGPFSDENLEPLRGLTNLELLQLHSSSSEFTGVGLRYLKDLPNLRALGLSSARQAKESALQSISEMAKLQTLALDSQWLTLETIDDLRQSLPGCRLFSCVLEEPPTDRFRAAPAAEAPAAEWAPAERPDEPESPAPPAAELMPDAQIPADPGTERPKERERPDPFGDPPRESPEEMERPAPERNPLDDLFGPPADKRPETPERPDPKVNAPSSSAPAKPTKQKTQAPKPKATPAPKDDPFGAS